MGAYFEIMCLFAALEVEGIFRRSANMKTVKDFCGMFNDGMTNIMFNYHLE